MWELTDTVLKFDTKETRNLGSNIGRTLATTLLEKVEQALYDGREGIGPLPASNEVVYGLRIALELSYNTVQDDVAWIVDVYNSKVDRGDQIHTIQTKDFESGKLKPVRYDMGYKKAA